MENDSIPRAISGPGNVIYNEMLKSLFRDAYQYDRVASYYNPQSLTIILSELARIWKRGGTVRLIIGFHETTDITPALKTDIKITQAIKDAVSKALVGKAKELADILAKQPNPILPVIRELINQHGLYVKLVTPRVNIESYKKLGKWPSPEIGIFHSKFLVVHHQNTTPIKRSLLTRLRQMFRRLNKQYFKPASLRLKRGEKFSVVTGSLNESVRGYTENIEDAVLHRSWIEPETPVCEYFLNRFEEIWMGNDKEVVTMPFTDELIKIFTEIERHETHDYFTWSDFTEQLSNSPMYHGIAFPNIGLLPHQIGVYTEALSRWPIRILLADEVGLGKTIEAGSIINYLLRFGGVKRVLILTPASLRRQWQEELKTHFGLDFWVYNSTKNTCEMDSEKLAVGSTPLSFEGKIDRVIVSWHWARIGIDENGSRFKEEDLPDLLIVDEAHHARIHDPTQGEKPTKLFQVLQELQKHIPHVVLLTATPFQTDIQDYYSLLSILGVPDGFKDGLKRYAKWFRGHFPPRFNTWVQQLKLVHQFMEKYQLRPSFPETEELEDTPTQNNTIFYEQLVRKMGELPQEVVIATHPTTLLATRNYRENLEKVGYNFPHVHLESPDIKISEKQATILSSIDEYIQRYLGSPERILNKSNNLGLMRSLYRQRMVSSIKAALDTLERRGNKLQRFIDSKDIEQLRPDTTDEFDASSNDEYDSLPSLKYSSGTSKILSSLIELSRTENHAIKRLVHQINAAYQEKTMIVDPKITKLKELLREHTNLGRKILIFSRFISTTEAIVHELKDFYEDTGIGRFDGQKVGIYSMADETVEFDECSREEIVEHLKTGRINIIVCSDAASEGLNLHYANVAINVDVPWNPSRLLQRFGRVDRLGQKADEVYLINLYYPGTIEERMYQVLEDRRTDFRAVLGETPEIMSTQQKKIITDLGTGSTPLINLTFKEIENTRAEYHRNQILGIKTIDIAGLTERSPYKQIIQILKESAIVSSREVKLIEPDTLDIDGKIISMNPLDDDFIGLSNLALSQFETTAKKPATKMMVYQFEDNSGQPLFFGIKDRNDLVPITSKNWPQLFNFIFKGEPLASSDLKRFSKNKTEELLKYMKETESWIWPDHVRISSISAVKPEPPSNGGIKVGSKIGHITIK